MSPDPAHILGRFGDGKIDFLKQYESLIMWPLMET
jgi:hypothetical protein